MFCLKERAPPTGLRGGKQPPEGREDPDKDKNQSEEKEDKSSEEKVETETESSIEIKLKPTPIRGATSPRMGKQFKITLQEGMSITERLSEEKGDKKSPEGGSGQHQILSKDMDKMGVMEKMVGMVHQPQGYAGRDGQDGQINSPLVINVPAAPPPLLIYLKCYHLL